MSPQSRAVVQTKRWGNRAFVMLESIADAMESSLQRYGWIWLVSLTAAYLLYACSSARLKPFWFDEVFTTYIARLDGPRAIWHALFGLELNPPGIYVATRAVEQWTGGEGLIRTRLPEIAAYWLMSVCLFLFIRRRCGPLYGLLGAMLPTGTIAITYAYEARPYAVVIGFCSLALLAWQSAAEGKKRWLTIPVLALSLAAAVSFHYYAALLFLAFGTGELIRTLRKRQIDLPMWIGIIVGALPLIAYIPLVLSVRSFFRGLFVKPESVTIESLYRDLFLGGWVLLAIVLVLSVRLLEGKTRKQEQERSENIPPEEIGIAVVLVLLPAVCWVISKFVVGQILVRYALSVVIGGSVLTAYALYHWRFRRSYAAVILLLLFAITGKRSLLGMKTLVRGVEEKPDYLSLIEQTPGNLPVVLFRCLEYVEASYYLNPQMAQRTRCLADVEAAFKSSGIDNLDRAALALRPYGPLNVDEFGPYVAAHREFLVLGRVTNPWLIERLLSMGAKISVVSQKGSTLWVLLHVQLPDNKP